MKENVLKKELNVSIEFLERFCNFDLSKHTEKEILSQLEKEEKFKIENNISNSYLINQNFFINENREIILKDVLEKRKIKIPSVSQFKKFEEIDRFFNFDGNETTIFSKDENNIIWSYTGFPDTMSRKYNERVYLTFNEID